MKRILISVLAAAVIAPLALAQKQEEAESYLVAPYTLNKMTRVTLPDYSTLRGKVVGGDEDKIVVLGQDGKRTDVPTSKIQLVQFRRQRRSNKIEFLASLAGGMSLGFAGSTIGKHAAMSIRSDKAPGRIGPIVGGVGLGFLGGYIGKRLARHAVTEEVTLTLAPEGGTSSPAAPKPAASKPAAPAAPRK